MNVVYAHDEAKGHEVAQRFASTPSGSKHSITRLSFKETNMDFTELGSGKAIPGVCDLGLKNTLYTASTPTLFSTSAMRTVYDSYSAFMRTHPSANRSILLFEAADGKVMSSLPDDHTAYSHRGMMTTNAIIQATWDEDPNGIIAEAANKWGKEARDLLARQKVSGYDKLHAYVNYANRDEPLAALYGYDKERQRRLTELKRKYDPHGFFNAYRALPMEMEGWEKGIDIGAEERERDEL